MIQQARQTTILSLESSRRIRSLQQRRTNVFEAPFLQEWDIDFADHADHEL